MTGPKPTVIQLPDGSQTYGIEVAFETGDEGWASYRLSDGGILRVRHTMLRVVRVTDEHGTPQYLPDGQPHYLVTEAGHVVAREGQPSS